MHESFELSVHLARDDETGRWYVRESDIPGLWLEADDAFALMQRIQDAAPEMIELNLDEIVRACRARDAAAHIPYQVSPARPAWKPVFDSPLALAHA